MHQAPRKRLLRRIKKKKTFTLEILMKIIKDRTKAVNLLNTFPDITISIKKKKKKKKEKTKNKNKNNQQKKKKGEVIGGKLELAMIAK